MAKQVILYEDPKELKALKKLFDDGEGGQREADTFWLLRHKSRLYRMVLRNTDGGVDEENFVTNLLCIIDEDSVRINNKYKDAKQKYEATLFAERIGKPSYNFTAKKDNFKPMFTGCQYTKPNWRMKKAKSVVESSPYADLAREMRSQMRSVREFQRRETEPLQMVTLSDWF